MAEIQNNLAALRTRDTVAFDALLESVDATQRALEIMETGAAQPARFTPIPDESNASVQNPAQIRHTSLHYFSAIGTNMIPVFAQLSATALEALRKEIPGFNQDVAPDRATLSPLQSQLYRMFVANRAFLGFLGDLPIRLTTAKALADTGDSLPLDLIANESRSLENLWFALDDFLKSAASLRGENMPAHFREEDKPQT